MGRNLVSLRKKEGGDRSPFFISRVRRRDKYGSSHFLNRKERRPHLSDPASDVRGPDRFQLAAAWAATAERGRWEGRRGSAKTAAAGVVAIPDRQGRVAAADFYRRGRIG
ncbi:hypothetical protein B296_00001613 [Ensete ventricosum]|uniref:Uncharacterized protein n=1 Tax=Ensete ventricosum TaxID=4639 RepID=A0A427AFB2_ENSVE|nr:hypothetical protein B296_00001613 [Ensete ventricosum]